MKDESKYTSEELAKFLEGLMSCGEPYQEAMDAFLGATSVINMSTLSSADLNKIETEE